jgi:hypothetical protein
MEWFRYVLYFMMGVQMFAWLWLQKKGGKLKDIHYITFCIMMMTGQAGASIECIITKAWGTLCVQVYFFIFTFYGACIRYRQMKTGEAKES